MANHKISELEINEVSLVDHPANAETDPATGRKVPRARVALFKRDGSLNRDRLLATQDRLYLIGEEIADIKKSLAAASEQLHSRQKEKTKMGFKKILKSATTREQIVAAVEEKARRIAKRDGIGAEAALAKAWTEHPEAQEAYESAPKPGARRPEPKTFKATGAECELDERARKRMKREPRTSYAKACSMELMEDPSLYTRYQKELAAGDLYDVPQPVEYLDLPQF